MALAFFRENPRTLAAEARALESEITKIRSQIQKNSMEVVRISKLKGRAATLKLREIKEENKRLIARLRPLLRQYEKIVRKIGV